jgi:ribonuclease HI
MPKAEGHPRLQAVAWQGQRTLNVAITYADRNPVTEPTADLKRGYYLLNTDGGNSGNPLGSAAIGALLRTRRLITVDQISKVIGPATHNVAEYQALIEGLKLAHDHGIERIRVYMDSELVVDQVNGVSAVRQAHLQQLHTVAGGLAALFKSIRISWVPREMNVEADRLVNAALGAARATDIGLPQTAPLPGFVSATDRFSF